MPLHVLALGLILFSLAVPAQAQEATPLQDQARQPQQQFDIHVDETTRKGQAAYQDAVRKLTQPQREELAALDKRFYASMQPVIQSYDIGGQLIFCMRSNSAFANNQQKYVTAFRAWRAGKDREQQEMWKELRGLAVKLTYIDHALLDVHYAYIQAAQISIVEQMVDKATQAGGYNGTNCLQVRDMLDAAAKTEEAPRKEFQGTFDGGGGGTSGVPAE